MVWLLIPFHCEEVFTGAIQEQCAIIIKCIDVPRLSKVGRKCCRVRPLVFKATSQQIVSQLLIPLITTMPCMAYDWIQEADDTKVAQRRGQNLLITPCWCGGPVLVINPSHEIAYGPN